MNTLRQVPSWLRPRARAGVGIYVPGPSASTVQGPATFQAPYIYKMVVWPIPQSVFSSATQVLTDLGFKVDAEVSNGDGSSTITATFLGATPLVTRQADAADVLVVTRLPYTNQSNVLVSNFQPGEDITGDTSNITARVVSEFDEPGGLDSTLTLLAFVGSVFQPGEIVRGSISGAAAKVDYQYGIVLRSPSTGAQLGVTSITKSLPVSHIHDPFPTPHIPVNPPSLPPPPPVPAPSPPPPVTAGATGPTTTSSTTTALAVGAAVIVVGGIAYWAYSHSH